MVIPRSIERGPVEAIVFRLLTEFKVESFRAQLSAAPLKLLFWQTLQIPCVSFRAQLSAAPLKRTDGSGLGLPP